MPRKETTAAVGTPRTTITRSNETLVTLHALPERVSEFGVDPDETDCPAHGNAVRVVCTDDVDPAEMPLSLDVDPTEGSLPAATFEFTLSNDTDATFKANFYDWAVRKRVTGRWHRVAPRGVPEPLMMVVPGGRHTWHLSIDNTRLEGSPDVPGGPAEIEIAGLGGGEYAFTTSGWFGDGNHDRQIGLAARFSLSGDPIELAPTNEVTGTVSEDDTVVVRTDVTSEDGRPAAFVLERTSEEPDRRMITEQAMRDQRFRNTLPFFTEGVDAVRLEEQNSTLPPFGVQEPYVVAYDGEAFRVSTEEL